MMFEQKFAFLLVVFCLYAAFWHWFFTGFFYFLSDFLLSDFPYLIFVHFRSSILSLFIENSLNCMSGLVRLCFLFRQQDFCYDHLTSQSPLQICFVFICSYIFNWIACVTSFFTLYRECFFVKSRDQMFGHTWLTSLSKMTFSLCNWLFFTLIQTDKVKWVCTALTEGYFRAANRISSN